MPAIETGRFTVGVFQDIPWAERGLDALKRHGFPLESLTIIGGDTPDLGAMIERQLGRSGRQLQAKGLPALLGLGPLIEAVDADRSLATVGLGTSMKRVGFQAHDGFIFETLTARGGILVAIRSEPRAADALAVLHAYGGGNAAIGAWLGRL
jgi:hypothetical protein